MKYAYYGFGMLLFGSIGLVLIVMMQSVTINNDSEYYDLKEAMKAAMIESVDTTCYSIDIRVNNEKCGGAKLKISEQKFVENFTRRFIATVGGDATKYTLKFYDIIESPPKASVVIEGLTKQYGIVSDNKQLTITNSLSGILEQKKILILDGRKYKVVDLDTLNSGYKGSNDVVENLYPDVAPEVVLGGDVLVEETDNYAEEKWELEPADSGCDENGCGTDFEEPTDEVVEDSNIEE